RFAIAVKGGRSRCTLFARDEVHSPGTALSVEVGREVTIVLEDDDVLVGTVTDESGDPIVDAYVHAWGMHGGALIDKTATPDARGDSRLPFPVSDRAAWQGDSESWIWWTEIQKKSFAPRVVRLDRNLDADASPGERRVDVVLHRGETVRGHVLDA